VGGCLARLLGRAAAGPSGEKGEGSWAGGCQEKKTRGPKTRKEGEKRKRILFLFIFQTNFPKAFSNNF